MSEQDWLLNEWLRMVHARWVVIGISRDDRAGLLRRLREDLTEARAAGASVEDLISTPPHVFADASATGLRSRHAPIDTDHLLVTCVPAGAVAAAVAWLVLALLSRVLVLPIRRPGPDRWGVGCDGGLGSMDVSKSC